jgi:hypothetical protein
VLGLARWIVLMINGVNEMVDRNEIDRLEFLASEEIRVAYEADSLTNWSRVEELRAEANELRLQANAESHKALMELFPYESGQGFTLGYIGNVESWGDDRSWRIFAHGCSDSFGDFKTDELHLLLDVVLGNSFTVWRDSHTQTEK